MKRRVIAVLLSAAAMACTREAHAPAAGVEPTPAPRAAATEEGARFEIEDKAGARAFLIKSKPDGFKAYDAADQELGKAKVESDRVKVKDSGDHEVLKIKRKERGVEIEDGAGQRLFRILPDGTDWKMEDAGGTVVLKLKAKENGYEARDAAGATLAKIKARDGKVVFETESGDRLGQVKGTTAALPAAWLALDRFKPLERAGLFAYFTSVHK
jgi:hypothetical protein